jgi:hypothetical protein
MNGILIFFRNLLKLLFLLFKNRQNDNIHLNNIITRRNDESEYILEAEIVQEPTNTIINQRRCGYCREQGHTVTHCNNAEILNYRNELQQLIDGDVSIGHITQWLNNKDDRLLKAIGCHYNILSFNRTYLRDIICRNIINYITREQFLNNLSNRQNSPIRPTESFEQKCIRLSITRIKIEPRFNVENNIQCFECPICLNNINEIDITKTNCNHNFCNICIINTIKNNPSIKNQVDCPLCRTAVKILFTCH